MSGDPMAEVLAVLLSDVEATRREVRELREMLEQWMATQGVGALITCQYCKVPVEVIPICPMCGDAAVSSP